jgi:hypothetical protein
MRSFFAFFLFIIYETNASDKPTHTLDNLFKQFCELSKVLEEEVVPLIPKKDHAKFGTVEDFKATLSRQISYVDVKMPKEYIPLVNTFKEIFPLNGDGFVFTQSYGIVKQMLLPLKDTYKSLIRSDKTYQLFKPFEVSDGCFNDFENELMQKHVDALRIIPMAFPQCYFETEELRKNPCDDAYRYFIKQIFNSIDLFFSCCKTEGYSYDYIIINTKDINFIISQPKEVIDQYCPLNFQKMLFPFYFIDLLIMCFNTCEGFYERYSNTPDVFNGRFSDDMPFIDVLAKVLSFDGYPHPQRLIENVYLMTEDPCLFEE